MKRLALAVLVGAAAMSATAQVNYRMQTACHPQDVKEYDTQLLRDRFVMEKVMVADEINLTYSLYDRLIFGGAVPATKELVLETIDPLKAEYFLERRELGVINVGGDGIVTVDGKEYLYSANTMSYVWIDDIRIARTSVVYSLNQTDISILKEFKLNLDIPDSEFVPPVPFNHVVTDKK